MEFLNSTIEFINRVAYPFQNSASFGKNTCLQNYKGWCNSVYNIQTSVYNSVVRIGCFYGCKGLKTVLSVSNDSFFNVLTRGLERIQKSIETFLTTETTYFCLKDFVENSVAKLLLGTGIFNYAATTSMEIIESGVLEFFLVFNSFVYSGLKPKNFSRFKNLNGLESFLTVENRLFFSEENVEKFLCSEFFKKKSVVCNVYLLNALKNLGCAAVCTTFYVSEKETKIAENTVLLKLLEIQ